MTGVWVEKYRPKDFEEVIGLDRRIKSIVDEDIPHLLFVGPPGIGKTTTARIIADKLNAEMIELNASDDRGIDIIRTKIKDFARMKTQNIKIILLDEADGLTSEAQNSLRRVMELYYSSTRFILTANSITKIIDPLKSRCSVFEFHPPKKKDILKRMMFILENEKVDYDEEDLEYIIETLYPDIRKIINMLQVNVFEGKLDVDVDVGSSIVDVIYELLVKRENKKIRKILINYSIDYNLLYRGLFDIFFEKDRPDILIIISEYTYRSGHVIDQMINFMGMVLTIQEKL